MFAKNSILFENEYDSSSMMDIPSSQSRKAGFREMTVRKIRNRANLSRAAMPGMRRRMKNERCKTENWYPVFPNMHPQAGAKGYWRTCISESIRVRYDNSGSVYVFSKPLLQGIRQVSHVLTARGSYIVEGEARSTDKVLIFPLAKAEKISESWPQTLRGKVQMCLPMA